MTSLPPRPDDRAGVAPLDALDDQLRSAVERVCRAGTLLVATDFDGVLAPLVDDPLAARPQGGTTEALRDLAALPRTHAAAVSGRALEVLAQLTGLGESDVTLIGSHGAELSHAQEAEGDRAAEVALLERVTEDLRAALVDHPGARLETKPVASVVHTRGLPAAEAEAATAAALEIAARHEDVEVLRGKDVVELLVIRTDKGTALRGLADRLGADAVVYLGDDVTDEHAFAVLGEEDLSIKVGAGETVARHRVAGPEVVAQLLPHLAAQRRTALA